LLALLLPSCVSEDPHAGMMPPVVPPKTLQLAAGKPVADQPGEPHLRNVRQLTFDGENAEAYWSGDGRKLILQRRNAEMPADQIHVLDLETGELKMVSAGSGRTTCSYYLQGDHRILFASTHHHGAEPPAVKVERGRYVWAVHREYDIFTADADGKNLEQLTDVSGYDAEATVCPVTGTIVFTSSRDGDLELYTMEPDGTDVRRITNRPGYDGGAFFSHDGGKLVLRSAFPRNEDEAKEDVGLLAQALVRPSHMEITVCKRDGSGFRQVTANGAANFAPYWFPDDRRIIFSSNMRGLEEAQRTGNHSLAGNFDLFVIGEDGSGLEQVTTSPEFDSFPMFSPDGRHLVFASNRYSKQRGETNIFVAEWVD
jgi:Tol biopolymer transport system component